MELVLDSITHANQLQEMQMHVAPIPREDEYNVDIEYTVPGPKHHTINYLCLCGRV